MKLAGFSLALNLAQTVDRANPTRRLMQANGIRPDQITQVRGFANQRLRKPDAPLHPAIRRISLIVQYLEKKPKDASGLENKEESGTANSKEGDVAFPRKKRLPHLLPRQRSIKTRRARLVDE